MKSTYNNDSVPKPTIANAYAILPSVGIGDLW
jgi:hypothetical protein